MSITNSPELLFWFWLLLLNSILFLPRLIMDWEETTLIPIKDLFKGSAFQRFRFISYRYNYDLFRFCFDLAVSVLGVYFFRSYLTIFWVQLAFFSLYLIWLVYLVYFNVFDKIYNLPPLFYSDRFMLKNGLKIAIVGFYYRFLSSLVLLAILCWLIYLSFEKMLFYLFASELTLLSLGILSLIIFMGFFSMTRYSYEQLPQQMVQSPIRSILKNIRSSLEAKNNLSQLNMNRLKRYNIYETIEFKKKPNIFFIMVESYGRILYDDPDLSTSYFEWIKKHEEKLALSNWEMATALSTAPIVGGASWLSYSSILYGFRIDNQGTYLSLANNPEISNYQSFFRLLQTKGYKNYHLNSLGGFEKMKIPWDTYSRFYAVDEWIRYKDLNYKGVHYGFGPSPPDQYALQFAENQIRQQKEEPFSLFFITQNSHSPFESPEAIVDDWRSLNTDAEPELNASKFFENPKKEDYLKAIKYQLDYLFNFIQKTGTDNDLFFIIGDHQPPVLTKREESQDTPVHIIAKNGFQPFIDGLETYGFKKGLHANPHEKPLAHEGLYSLFMRNMVQYIEKYDESKLPPYRPNGIPLRDENIGL